MASFAEPKNDKITNMLKDPSTKDTLEKTVLSHLGAVEVKSWSVKYCANTSALRGTEGVFMLDGVATRGSEEIPWSTVVKVFSKDTHPEFVLYKSGYIGKVFDELKMAPRAYAVTQTTDADGSPLAWAWMERVEDVHSWQWTPDVYYKIANYLGRFHGAHKCGKLGDPPTMAFTFADELSYMLTDKVDYLAEPKGECAQRIFPLALREAIQKVKTDPGYDALKDWMKRIPTVISHGDAHLLNIFVDNERVALVDWELLCLRPLAHDLARLFLVAPPLTFGFNDSLTRMQFSTELIRSYCEGLRASGFDLPNLVEIVTFSWVSCQLLLVNMCFQIYQANPNIFFEYGLSPKYPSMKKEDIDVAIRDWFSFIMNEAFPAALAHTGVLPEAVVDEAEVAAAAAAAAEEEAKYGGMATDVRTTCVTHTKFYKDDPPFSRDNDAAMMKIFTEDVVKLIYPEEAATVSSRVLLPDVPAYTVITPSNSADSGPLPVFLWISPTILFADTMFHQPLGRLFAERARCVVILVGHNPCPENDLEKVVANNIRLYEALGDHAAELRIDPTRVALGSMTLGAHIAATMALRLRSSARPPRALVLTHPALSPRCDTASQEKYGHGFLVSKQRLQWLWLQLFGGNEAKLEQAKASGTELDNASLAGLPSTLLVTAGFDPTRDEALALAARLTEAGVNVKVTDMADQPNTAFGNSRSEGGTAAARECAAALGELLK